MGDSEEMRAVAETLDKIQSSLVNIYVKRTGQETGAISEMMDAETWLSSADALDGGFINEITDSVNVAAKSAAFAKHFKNMPFDNDYEEVKNIETVKDYERFLRDSSGVSKGLATALTSRAKAIFQGDPDGELSDIEVQQLTSAINRIGQLVQ